MTSTVLEPITPQSYFIGRVLSIVMLFLYFGFSGDYGSPNPIDWPAKALFFFSSFLLLSLFILSGTFLKLVGIDIGPTLSKKMDKITRKHADDSVAKIIWDLIGEVGKLTSVLTVLVVVVKIGIEFLDGTLESVFVLICATLFFVFHLLVVYVHMCLVAKLLNKSRAMGMTGSIASLIGINEYLKFILMSKDFDQKVNAVLSWIGFI